MASSFLCSSKSSHSDTNSGNFPSFHNQSYHDNIFKTRLQLKQTRLSRFPLGRDRENKESSYREREQRFTKNLIYKNVLISCSFKSKSFHYILKPWVQGEKSQMNILYCRTTEWCPWAGMMRNEEYTYQSERAEEWKILKVTKIIIVTREVKRNK